jgi:galactose mutarotase-like enzyme
VVSTAQLTSAQLAATVDLDRGAEIASLRHLPSGTGILMATPWADEARALRPVPGRAPEESEAIWQASYAGGWQTLFPHAGAPETVDGQVRTYHGEASIVPWELDGAGPTQVEAHLVLTSVPARIDRVIRLDGDTLSVTDRIENVGTSRFPYDYQSHPAFGAPFLEGGCTITADAAFYTPHPEFDIGEFDPGRPVSWPRAESRAGAVDLASIPAPGAGALRFGWLTGFTHRGVTITNPRSGIAATLSWIDPLREVAWLWQDAGADIREPWLGRGYTTAIEPSTRTTASGGHDAPVLEAHDRVTFTTRLTIQAETPAAKEHAQ